MDRDLLETTIANAKKEDDEIQAATDQLLAEVEQSTKGRPEELASFIEQMMALIERRAKLGKQLRQARAGLNRSPAPGR
jgi:hypothetical protein